MFNNNFLRTTNFIVASQYRYVWESGKNNKYVNQFGIGLYPMHESLWKFSFEFSMYEVQYFFIREQIFDSKNNNYLH